MLTISVLVAIMLGYFFLTNFRPISEYTQSSTSYTQPTQSFVSYSFSFLDFYGRCCWNGSIKYPSTWHQSKYHIESPKDSDGYFFVVTITTPSFYVCSSFEGKVVECEGDVCTKFNTLLERNVACMKTLESVKDMTLEKLSKYVDRENKLWGYRYIKEPEFKKIGNHEFYIFCISEEPRLSPNPTAKNNMTKCEAYTLCGKYPLKVYIIGGSGSYYNEALKIPYDYAPSNKTTSGYAWNTYLEMLSTLEC